MISGFEQMMNEREEHARKQGITQRIKQGVERGNACEKEHGIQVLLKDLPGI